MIKRFFKKLLCKHEYTTKTIENFYGMDKYICTICGKNMWKENEKYRENHKGK